MLIAAAQHFLSPSQKEKRSHLGGPHKGHIVRTSDKKWHIVSHWLEPVSPTKVQSYKVPNGGESDTWWIVPMIITVLHTHTHTQTHTHTHTHLSIHPCVHRLFQCVPVTSANIYITLASSELSYCLGLSYEISFGTKDKVVSNLYDCINFSLALDNIIQNNTIL